MATSTPPLHFLSTGTDQWAADSRLPTDPSTTAQQVFRSEEGGRNFARIRSYISTLSKQVLNSWHGLVSVCTGDVLMPNFNP